MIASERSTVPVFEPVIGDAETANVLAAIESGSISGSFGRFITAFEERFARYCGCQYGVAVTSGSTALHLAAVLAKIEPGDEVLVSASTNIATANAIVQCGGKVVPVDVCRDSWCMDTNLLEDLVTPRTKAILPVHLFGHPVDMDQVWWVAARHGLVTIEDAAEAHGAKYHGRKVGGLSDVACFSFYANKVITTGEGGMLVTDRADYAERARSLRNLAFRTPRFWHTEVGYNYRMTNLQAAIGCGQLDRIEDTIQAKRTLAHRYNERLGSVAGLRLPVELPGCRNVYWMYGIVVEPEFRMTRDELTHLLAAHGIETRTMFCPLNFQPALLDLDAVGRAPCPVAESLWSHGLYLPSTPTLTDSDLDYICDVIAGRAR